MNIFLCLQLMRFHCSIYCIHCSRYVYYDKTQMSKNTSKYVFYKRYIHIRQGLELLDLRKERTVGSA